MNNQRIVLSVIVIHLGSDELLINFLQSLYKFSLPFEFETIVVDNFSNSNKLPIITNKYINCRIIKLNDRVGYSTATNIGIAESKGQYLLWCNNDLIFKENSINYLYQFLHNNTDYAIVSPCLFNEDYSLQPCYSLYSLNVFTLIFHITGFNSKNYLKSFDIKVAPGACCMISKNALETIGGKLDESYYMYCEEFDLSYKFLKSFFKIRYLGISEVIHLGGKTTNKTSVNFLIQSFKSKLNYLSKNFGNAQKNLFYIFLIIKFFLKTFFYFLIVRIFSKKNNSFVINKNVLESLLKIKLLNSNKLVIYYND